MDVNKFICLLQCQNSLKDKSFFLCLSSRGEPFKNNSEAALWKNGCPRKKLESPSEEGNELNGLVIQKE